MTIKASVVAFVSSVLICALSVAALAGQAKVVCRGRSGSDVSDRVPASLTPEMLGMSRSQIAMGDRKIRLFNGRDQRVQGRRTS